MLLIADRRIHFNIAAKVALQSHRIPIYRYPAAAMVLVAFR